MFLMIYSFLHKKYLHQEVNCELIHHSHQINGYQNMPIALNCSVSCRLDSSVPELKSTNELDN